MASSSPERAKRETVLVVDDNETVLHLVVNVLQRAGFHVLSAASGSGAVVKARAELGSIDLLLSDVDLPDMSGSDLGQAMKKDRPDLRVVLMSGGPSGNLPVLNHGWAFIQKPFVPARLIDTVTDVLSQKDRTHASGQEFDPRETHGGSG